MSVFGLLLLLSTQLASAGDVPVSATLSSAFGTQVGPTVGPLASSNGANFTSSIAEYVYLCSGSCSDAAAGVYTYIFDVSNSSSSHDPLKLFTTYTNGTFNYDDFSASLNFGNVNDAQAPTTGGKTDTECGGTGFCFDPTTLTVNLVKADGGTPLPVGKQFSFYAQSFEGPSPGEFAPSDGGAGTNAPTLDPGPEPQSVLLFGSGVLAIGMMLRRRQHSGEST